MRSAFASAAILFSTLAPLLLAGCAAPRSPLPDIDTTLAEIQPLYSGRALTDCLATPLPAQRPCRDTLAQAMMAAVDLRYAEFEIAFFDANRGAGFGSSVALLGLGAAGSLAATGTAQVLSAISAAVTGTREAFGRELLAEQTAAALLTSMRNARNQVALRLREGLARSAEQYPLGIALSDLYAYYRAGTLPGALTGLTEVVGERARATQEELRLATVGSGFARTPLALSLRDFLGAPGLTAAQRQERQRAVIAAAQAEGFGNVPFAAFINDQSAVGEDRRARVARRLGLQP